MKKTNKLKLLFQALVLAGITGMAVLGLMSFGVRTVYADFWEQLGTNQNRGTSSIKQSFLYGSFYHHSSAKLKNILSGDKAAVAQDLLKYTKEVVNSEAFAQEYEKFRTSAKPTPPEPAKTEAVIRQKFIDDAQKGVDNLEKLLKTMTDPASQKSLKDGLAQTKGMLKDVQDPNSEMIKMAVAGEQNNFKYRNDQYEASLKAWQEEYPAGVKPMIKARLQKLLDITKDVDFSAQLTERDGKKYFVKKEYEAKPADWKKAFRAGKEVTTTVQAFARQWLQELP